MFATVQMNSDRAVTCAKQFKNSSSVYWQAFEADLAVLQSLKEMAAFQIFKHLTYENIDL